ncbi:TPR repeat containing exported protein / putative periplasmic protein [Cystobacter fuscus DSM 2262]|uniref:TPR repeat containing exported protein / putative periplasmic protein n=1 Tax=Cystobacter fuscus (strain ATCC 25194 / DSM 2262 / NBRC 100088 / M29) TaxID=1242864 RepID=S9PHH2_CYSF2|nr:tetratricopeptide repeat protein [Cystobacter fuscus]EPX62511.1 TPR repeat containing exported protein / putative periplasmic protein [Cystobacter fuscus DSM 2262]
MRRLALIALPFLLSGCFYPAARGRALETRLDQLDASQVQIQAELKRTREQLDATLPLIDEKIAQVSKALEGLDKASRRSGADIGIQLQKTVEDLAQLRGQVETYVYKIGELEAALARTTEDTDKRLLELKGEQALKEAEARKKAEELKRPTDKKEFLALAQDKAKAGDVVLARQLYGEFLKKWPKDALVAEAHFGLGESYFAEDKCREALFEYGKLLQEHPKAASTPEAYLRSSECFQKLKMQDEARLALEELVKGYPKTDAAKTAKTRLAELDKAKKKGSKK